MNTVRFDCFHVYINHTIVLTCSWFSLGIVSQPEKIIDFLKSLAISNSVQNSSGHQLCVLGWNVIFGLPCSAVIKGVDKCQWHGASTSSRQNVLSKLFILGCIFCGFKHGFYGILESEIQGLCWEISNNVSHVTCKWKYIQLL